MFDQVGTALGVIILLMMVLIIILTLITISMSMRLSRLAKKYKLFMRGRDAQTMEHAILGKFDELDALTEQSGANTDDLEMIKTHLGKSLTHYGIIKYDAFDDVGGKMSFALAMLDSENSGFILDTIHSKDNCFVYLKEIVKGESYIMLSKEEIAALKMAANDIEADELESRA